MHLQELMEVVRSHTHNGIMVVDKESIPESWQPGFLAASAGSMRMAAGPYRRDLQVFVRAWSAEMSHLEAHRALLHR